VPFRVDETDRSVTVRLYGVAADMDWVRYGGTDPLIRLISFDQPAEDEATVTVELERPVWGYRTRWFGTTLLLEIRRPPVIDPRHPLRGRRVAVDAGHPPLGAIGPTGLREANVVLDIARRTQALLERAGAQVVMVRTGDSAVDLAERLRIVERADAEVLVSIHANALPDGVNPFVNTGTSVYYFQPRSAPLARQLNRALVAQFGVRDLGMGRGDLAMVRTTWMPAALTEGLFIMVPDQEAMLASPAGQERYARGVVNGLTAFLAGAALAP
jgi:N-acetylmuramoyl-L-alanine amidase